MPDGGEKVQSVVCFAIAPGFRGKGVATKLLEFICEDAKNRGYEIIEAYLFARNERHAYHGPTGLYEKLGFERCFTFEGCRVMRKRLK